MSRADLYDECALYSFGDKQSGNFRGSDKYIWHARALKLESLNKSVDRRGLGNGRGIPSCESLQKPQWHG